MVPGMAEPQTQTIEHGGSPRRLPVEAIVRVVSGAAATPQVRVSMEPCVVGSAPGCELRLLDAGVSRRHLELVLVRDGVMVRDLGSKNGTFYLGQRVERMTLALGSRVQVGGVTLALEPDAQALASLEEYQGEDYRGVIGRSAAMRRLFAVMTRLEGSLVTVLIAGESGVGKEVIARAIHDGSTVADGPLVAVNCGAIPRELVASELFGHRKGAFTGAIDHRKGAFEQADGGTLFLDEIGELPLDMQPVLLRVLETGELRPVGAQESRRVNVRIVAATNLDLEQQVRAGRFREDLYYRLAVVRLWVPPLRERLEDIELLARRFAQQAGLGDVPALVLDHWKSRDWPGNARQLRNSVQSYSALGAVLDTSYGSAAPADATPAPLDLQRPYADQKQELTDRFTRAYLEGLLKACNGNRTAAARRAGLDRAYLVRLLAKYGLTGHD